MKRELKHEYLNLFRFFGGDYRDENNLTRAFLCLLSRSPWGMAVLSGVLDRLSKSDPELAAFQGVPKGIAFAMQQGVARADFLPDDVTTCALVGLVPDSEPGRASDSSASEQAVEVRARGIVDATIVLRKDERLLALVIEAKLYGEVGEYQWAQYLEAIKDRTGCPPLETRLTWDDIDCLVDRLPEEAKADPLVRDFSDLIRERPHLVSFPAFRPTDFSEGAPLDGRLERLCQRLKDEKIADLTVTGFERKRGGYDYDLRLQETGLKGNLGLASWNHTSVSSKLVIGSRTYWETSHVLDRSGDTPEVMARLREGATPERLTLEVYARVYFHRFDTPWRGPLPLPSDQNSIDEKWSQALQLARTLHTTSCTTDDGLTKLRQVLPDDESKGEILSQILATPAEKRPSIFIAFVFCLTHPGEDLAKRSRDDQLADIKRDLATLGGLLVALSA